MRRLWQALREPAVARFAALLALIAGCGLLVLLIPRPDLAALSGLPDRLGLAAPVLAVVGGALLLTVLVPRTFITLTWGALFGPVAGAGYSLAAATLAALIGFGVGRWLGREYVASRTSAAPAGGLAGRTGRVRLRLAQLDRWFTTQSVLGVVTVRLLPVSGFGMVSLGYGTTGVRLTPFLIGSVLASAPTAVGYAVIGAAVVAPGEVNWLAAAPAGLGAAATVVLLLRWRRAVRASAAAARVPDHDVTAPARDRAGSDGDVTASA
ncbi:VTT domain-containing protein [Solwaraspora sp. WMMA2080]|uniref:TVP38/TMEM64 family protein n=1 Tax=unclassified Solwaraspora TaxID=2627926 RepID=UPI00248AABEA|nr:MULTISPECIES: VTT domain-containing protein [unclassified Solwaraspora]WBB94984.1 VTT domain-containing protein [Solwaraspora sp. WMMA2059]WBC21133.1 VTT domain-containing protein [Solwaraspora sp. WMMA2080]